MNLDDFIAYERRRGIKQTKLLPYHLKPFFVFLAERDLAVAEARPKDIQEFQTWLSTLLADDGTMRYAAFTIRTILGIGRRYCNYLKHSGRLASNPFLHIKQIKPQRKLPHDIPNEPTMQEFLEQLRTFWIQEFVKERRLYYRCHVLAELLYATGLRISEALALQAEDIQLSSNTIRVRDGKGGRERLAYLNEYAAAVLRFYLEEMRPVVLVNKDSDLVFGIASTATISSTVHTVLRQAGAKLGLGRFTSHSFRYTLGYHLLKRGCDLRYIQLILGHEDMNTTTIYTKVTKEDLKTQLDTYHPRAGRNRRAG